MTPVLPTIARFIVACALLVTGLAAGQTQAQSVDELAAAPPKASSANATVTSTMTLPSMAVSETFSSVVGVSLPTAPSSSAPSSSAPATASAPEPAGLTTAPTSTLAPAGSSVVGTVQHAKSDTPIKAEVTTHKVVIGAKGRVSLQAAVDLKPGDVIQIVGTFYNPNWYPVRFDPQIALPRGAGLVVGSIAPASGRLGGPKDAPSVGWKIEKLDSGATAVVRMRARILPTAPSVSG